MAVKKQKQSGKPSKTKSVQSKSLKKSASKTAPKNAKAAVASHRMAVKTNYVPMPDSLKSQVTDSLKTAYRSLIGTTGSTSATIRALDLMMAYADDAASSIRIPPKAARKPKIARESTEEALVEELSMHRRDLERLTASVQVAKYDVQVLQDEVADFEQRLGELMKQRRRADRREKKDSTSDEHRILQHVKAVVPASLAIAESTASAEQSVYDPATDAEYQTQRLALTRKLTKFQENMSVIRPTVLEVLPVVQDLLLRISGKPNAGQ
eukprot:ANDGO_04368.mRNA.1 hypothetical protein